MDATVQQEGELRQRLRDVNEAISAAMAGQSYSIGGRTLTRQDLGTLQNERTRIVRDLRTLKALLDGSTSPGQEIATWYR